LGKNTQLACEIMKKLTQKFAGFISGMQHNHECILCKETPVIVFGWKGNHID